MITLPWRHVEIETGRPVGTSLTVAEAQTLRGLAEARWCLEVGAAYGFSAITMAQVARHVISVDPHENEVPESLDGMRANVAAYGLQNKISIVIGRSQSVLPALWNLGATFQLIFIDGDHHMEAVEHDITWARKLLADGDSVLACHDYDEFTCPGVRQAIDHHFTEPYLVDTLWIRYKRDL